MVAPYPNYPDYKVAKEVELEVKNIGENKYEIQLKDDTNLKDVHVTATDIAYNEYTEDCTFLTGCFSENQPTVYPISPTITNVNGDHAAHPLIKSNSAIPKAPHNALVRLPNRKAPMNRGTFPR